MEHLPVVAIVGAPNVGKSTLFNRIIRRKIAVIDDMPGVTRDRNYIDSVWNGVRFTLVDTGGIIPDTKKELDLEVNRQVEIALEEADVVVYLADAQQTPTYADIEIAARLRRGMNEEQILLAVNKCDTRDAELTIPSFWELGVGKPYAISAAHGQGVAHFLDRVVERLHKNYDSKGTYHSYSLSVAVIGRPNAGKSSLVNALLQNERTIVSEVAGTTRDSIDTVFEYEGEAVKLIDTAGLRKKARVKESVEYYSNLRTLRSIYRADVCLLLMDTTEPLTTQDMRVIRRVKHDNRGLILIWNKWDLIEKNSKTFDILVKETRASFPELHNIPMISICALSGLRVQRVLDMAFAVQKSLNRRIPRYELERAFEWWVKTNPHPYTVGEKIKFFSIKQEKTNYPHFIVFCTNPHRMTDAYCNYLRNKLVSTFDFTGTFVKLDFRLPGKARNRGGDEDVTGFVKEYTL
ncbi:ribosome biogenesis GTPase Der [Chitinivibrio alkaliphilus]|uniref:GTPase Der n=1 Tax=Chitinivibrio alkaliphilus ACht1 TaxID=1313304 RepID=U7D5S1_9BACT|nr:ribosome biogenesis GTPase Der [Chitinivibrio alkaliphilus]ERP31318.1 ribosome-associated GTPase EngA [Chitinivibrio alkaliphilus ACht1]